MKEQTPIEESLELLKSKIVNCSNTTTIFDTRDYVKLDDVIHILSIQMDTEQEYVKQKVLEALKKEADDIYSAGLHDGSVPLGKEKYTSGVDYYKKQVKPKYL